MNDNFAKIVALAIVGGVAKAFFGPPPAPITHVHNHPETKLAAVPEKEEN